MDRFNKALEECNQLQETLRILKSKPVPAMQETVKQIQIQFLKAKIQKLGQRLSHLDIYRNRRDHHDGPIPE